MMTARPPSRVSAQRSVSPIASVRSRASRNPRSSGSLSRGVRVPWTVMRTSTLPVQLVAAIFGGLPLGP